MTCSHRRRRPVLGVLAGLAAVLIAGGYGLMAGAAHGHADAMKINRTSYQEGHEMTLKEFKTDPELVAAVREQLTASFEGTRMRPPDPDEVIEDALRTARVAIGEHAADQADCNKVDPCRAKSLVLERLSAWLETSQS